VKRSIISRFSLDILALTTSFMDMVAFRSYTLKDRSILRIVCRNFLRSQATKAKPSIFWSREM